jgi:3,2-trans-enoyl-CoA isomerase
MDIKEFVNADIRRLRDLRGTYLDCCLKLYSSIYPTAACLNGHAIGGGCFLAMACEYRAMVSNFKIGLNETQLGIAIPDVAILATKNIISSRNAEMALTLGQIFSTEEAFKIGLVDKVAEDKNEAMSDCINYLSKFKKIPYLARGITKQMYRDKVIKLMITNRDSDIENFVSYIKSPSSQKSLQLFLETSKKSK